MPNKLGKRAIEGAGSVSTLALELEGEYAFYEERERWFPAAKERGLTPWIVGQMVYDNHESGRFRARVLEDSVTAGSSLHLKIEGVTPFAVLAIVSGPLKGPPPEAFGKMLIPLEESLDVLVQIPEDAEGGTYIFFGQQWEPDGQPAYPGGSLIYPSAVASVEVRSSTEDETFWESFESWSEEDAGAVRENIRRLRAER